MIVPIMIAAAVILYLSDQSHTGGGLLGAKGAILAAWLKPVTGPVSSGYGNRYHDGKMQFHNGIDIAVPIGTPVLSPADGEVTSIYSNATGGNQLIVTHANGYQSGYAHLKSYNVYVGQKVSRGQKIAYSGNTGNSTGPHLHFTVRLHGNHINPSNILPV